MDTHRQLRKRLCHSLGNPRDFIGEASAVGVAQSQARGAALLGRPQGFHGKFRIFLVAVEEMLGVKKHPLAPAGQIAAGILDHAQVFRQGRAQDLSHMKVPAFAEHRHDRGVGGKQRPDVAVILRLDPLAAGGAKGHKLGVLPLGFVDPPEKLQVLGVRARVSRLDKRNPQLIQLLYDSQLILHGKGNSLSLGSVSQGRIENFNRSFHDAFPFYYITDRIFGQDFKFRPSRLRPFFLRLPRPSGPKLRPPGPY